MSEQQPQPARRRAGVARGPIARVVVGCAAGGLLVLLASGRVWSRAELRSIVGTGHTQLSVTGHAVAPTLPALGIALVALAAAIIAGRGLIRRVVGLVVVLIGAVTLGVAVTARGDVSAALERHETGARGIPVHAAANEWWLLAALGAAIAIVAGAMTVFRGGRWAELGAAYDAPTAAPPPRPTDAAATAWAALDRGDDPTA